MDPGNCGRSPPRSRDRRDSRHRRVHGPRARVPPQRRGVPARRDPDHRRIPGTDRAPTAPGALAPGYATNDVYAAVDHGGRRRRDRPGRDRHPRRPRRRSGPGHLRARRHRRSSRGGLRYASHGPGCRALDHPNHAHHRNDPRGHDGRLSPRVGRVRWEPRDGGGDGRDLGRDLCARRLRDGGGPLSRTPRHVSARFHARPRPRIGPLRVGPLGTLAPPRGLHQPRDPDDPVPRGRPHSPWFLPRDARGAGPGTSPRRVSHTR